MRGQKIGRTRRRNKEREGDVERKQMILFSSELK